MTLPLRIRVDLDIITLKGYSTFPKSPKPETHHQMLFNVVHRTPLGGRIPTPPKGYSLRI